MTGRDTRETPEQAKYGVSLLLNEVAARVLAANRAIDALDAPPTNSVLGKIDALTTPFNASEAIRMYMAVALDNLRTLVRYVRKTNELPMIAAYSLVRSAVEATSLGIWVLKGNGNDIKAQRSLRITLRDFEQHGRLQKLVGSREFDIEDIQESIRTLNLKLRGLDAEAIDDEVQLTSVVIAADQQVSKRHYFNGAMVWRATSGLSHASLPAISVLLERGPDSMRTSRATFVAGFSVVAIENLESLIDVVRRASKELPAREIGRS